jgi:hypothetical protein
MPLRDHFHPPVSNRHSWEAFHAQWPAMLVTRLAPVLPLGFLAEPRVHLGRFYEIDIGTFETADRDELSPDSPGGGGGGVATAPYVAPSPTAVIDADLGEEYEYEVLVFDATRERTLVAVEFVSPANKDRPEHRRAFVTKCAALLQKGICVSLVDVVTGRQSDLYAELLEMIGRSDPTWQPGETAIYAVSCRPRTVRGRSRLETWAYPLELGRPLPSLPLWLTDGLAISLDLEGSYEETCRALQIP